MSNIKSILDSLNTCFDSYDNLYSLLPDLLSLSHQNNNLRLLLLDHIDKTLSAKSSLPHQKFYALYFLLKIIENKNIPFACELAERGELLSYILRSAQTDPHRNDAIIFERGVSFFAQNPSRSQAKTGINFVKLCIELILYLDAEYGAAEHNNPRSVFKYLANALQKKAKVPSTSWFVGQDYIVPKKRELYDWNFNKGSPVGANQVQTKPSLLRNPTVKLKGDVEEVNDEDLEDEDSMVMGSQPKQTRFTSLGVVDRKECLRQNDVCGNKAEQVPNLQTMLSLSSVKKVLTKPTIQISEPEVKKNVSSKEKADLDSDRISERKNRLLAVLKLDFDKIPSPTREENRLAMSPELKTRKVLNSGSQSNSSRRSANFDEDLLKIQENINLSKSKKYCSPSIKIGGMVKVPSYAGSSPVGGRNGLTPVSDTTDFTSDKVKSLTSLDEEGEFAKWKRGATEKRKSANPISQEENLMKIRMNVKNKSAVGSGEKENRPVNFSKIGEVGKVMLSPSKH